MHDLWLRSRASVLSLTFQNADGRISSGTAFKVGDFLITNNHVVQVPTARKVTLRGVRPDGYTTALELSFGHLEFRTMLIDGDPETAWDYAVLRVSDPAFAALPSLDLVEHDDVKIGSPVALLGYQFDQPQQSMHMGYVSSQYDKAGVHYLQLDSSVNHGNSGGPLIDPETGRVIGIVTRKATGLTSQFDALQTTFRKNIGDLQELRRRGGFVLISNIDPIAAALATQQQMDQLSREIGRSANVGIGYAYHIKKLRSSLAHFA